MNEFFSLEIQQGRDNLQVVLDSMMDFFFSSILSFCQGFFSLDTLSNISGIAEIATKFSDALKTGERVTETFIVVPSFLTLNFVVLYPFSLFNLFRKPFHFSFKIWFKN